MLTLRDIHKEYPAGDMKVAALRGVSISFRKSEFVSILGPSGCGKTTLLNIIGGLDQYTSGDLIIGGRSTKNFKDADWDAYRNHSIGFVFQSDNLIPHQSVLANVELALTISGVSKAERRRRAKEALEKVGLGKEIEALAERMGAYVGCTFMGLSAVNNDCERFLGMQGMHGHYASSMAQKEADLIFAIGVRFSDRATGNVSKYAKNSKIVQLDPDFAEINKNVRVDVGIIGDVCPRCGRREGEEIPPERVDELKRMYPDMPAFQGIN